MDFTAGPWLSGAMRYRIELSQSRNGYARVNFPGRNLAIEADRHVGQVWLVAVSDVAGEAAGSVTVRAGSAGEAVWRVASAAVHAVAEITSAEITGVLVKGATGTGSKA